jgi:hypothetical protein
MFLTYKSSFFAWFEVGSHNPGFHTGGDLSGEDSSKSVESTFIRSWYHFTDVHHQWGVWIARFNTDGAWIVHWSFIQKFASVFLGSDWRWQVDGDHLQQSFTSWEPVSHDGFHEGFFYESVFFGGEEVLASEPIVHDFLFHVGPFFFFVVFGGGEGGVDWVQDELDEGSFETDFLVFVVFQNGFSVSTFLLWFLLPFLSVGIEVVITPKFGHELVDVFDSKFFGVNISELFQTESPTVKTGTESDVTSNWVNLNITHWCIFIGTTVSGNNDVNGFDCSLKFLVQSFHIVLEGTQSKIELVQEQDWLNSFGDGLSENGLGLDADTGNGINDNEGTIGDS